MSSRELAIVEKTAARVALATSAPGRVRIVLDGHTVGPVLSARAAKVVARWLREGALDDLDGTGGSKLENALSAADHAFDLVGDLLKNGLR